MFSFKKTACTFLFVTITSVAQTESPLISAIDSANSEAVIIYCDSVKQDTSSYKKEITAALAHLSSYEKFLKKHPANSYSAHSCGRALARIGVSYCGFSGARALWSAARYLPRDEQEALVKLASAFVIVCFALDGAIAGYRLMLPYKEQKEKLAELETIRLYLQAQLATITAA